MAAGEPIQSEARARTLRRVGGWAGVIGPSLFVVIFTIEGSLRPGYEPMRTFVSALSLGPRGWIQILNFIVVGTAFLVFACGIATQFPDGRASRFGPILLAAIGLGLIASGPFVMDSTTAIFARMTLHGRVHAILGALVFSLGPAVCFVFFRRFRVDPEWEGLRGWTLAAGVVMVVAAVLMKLATLPPPAPPNPLAGVVGAIQRVSIFSLMGWVASVGWVMTRRSRLS
jgi:hypothetical protein